MEAIMHSEIKKINKLIAEAYKIRHFDIQKSLLLCDEAVVLSEKINYKKGVADAFNQKGFCYVQLADYESALMQLNAALPIFTAIDDKTGIGNANYNLGLVFIRIGDYSRALEHELKSLSIRETIQDNGGAANCYMQIGYIYENFNDLDAALNNYEQSLILHKKVGNVGGEAAGLMGIASVYIVRNDHEKVKEYLNKCIAIRKTINDPRGYGATLQRYAIYYFQNNNYDDARKVTEEGIAIATPAGDKLGLARFYIQLGKIFCQTKKYDEAIDALHKAQSMAHYLNFKVIEFEIHLALSEVYTLLHDYQQALQHYTLFHKTKEEVMNSDIAVKIRNIETIRQMESATKEAEINRLKNVELKNAYQEIEEKNKNITDSINYAKRIQQAKLPAKQEIYFSLAQSFVLFKPKDIVSGDFYAFHKSDSYLFIAAADCTGHGVPGALMSMIGSEKLNEAIAITTNTSEILKKLNIGIKKSLHQSESNDSTRDGMDIALCSIDAENFIVKYAGANRPLWLIRKGQKEVEEIKATKKAIGGLTPDNQHFDTHELKLQQGDTFYICTDGYADQFGGKDGKKLMVKKLKEVLLSIQYIPMQEQEKHLADFMEKWKGAIEQVDDILVIGIRL